METDEEDRTTTQDFDSVSQEKPTQQVLRPKRKVSGEVRSSSSEEEELIERVA